MPVQPTLSTASLRRQTPAVIAALAASVLSASSANAAPQVLGPDFAQEYAIVDLGPVPGVPTSYGGLLVAPGDTGVLLIGGQAASADAAIYAAVLTRAPDGVIIGFSGVASYFLAAPGVTGGIDGGLDVGPGDVLFYTTYGDNQIGQIGPGSTGPDRLVDLTSLGVATSTGALRFVPTDFPGAGRLKIASFDAGLWYDATVAPDGNGTFDIAVSPNPVNLGGGLEGIAYVKGGTPGFSTDSVLVCDYTSGQVTAYEIDGNGDPIPASTRVFIGELAGAEGATVDPVTGDFLFSTFGGGDRVLRVSRIAAGACPGDLDGDRSVGGADLGALLTSWGSTSGGSADINADDIVDAADLGLLLAAWGACPPAGR